jgi:hypothetical protein
MRARGVLRLPQTDSLHSSDCSAQDDKVFLAERGDRVFWLAAES